MPERKAVAQFTVSDDVLWKLRQEAANQKKTLAVLLRELVQNSLNASKIEIDLSEGLESWGGDRRESKRADDK